MIHFLDDALFFSALVVDITSIALIVGLHLRR